MFYIPNNPLILPKINNSPSTPPGTRGLFAKEDGWYEIDESGLSKKIATGLDTQENTDILNRLRYYGSADIKPSDKNLFTFTIDNSTMTAGVQKRNSSISGDIVIPYECIVDGKTYLITHINNEAFYDCYDINSVYLPNTITYIGATSFGCCKKLSNILIPSSVFMFIQALLFLFIK